MGRRQGARLENAVWYTYLKNSSPIRFGLDLGIQGGSRHDNGPDHAARGWMEMKRSVRMTINGESHEREVEPLEDLFASGEFRVHLARVRCRRAIRAAAG